MSSALLVRFRPAGPWRLGPDNGTRTRTGTVLHSDSLYSAITLAMRDCGWLDEWIAATAQSAAPAVRISSGYPFTGSTLLVVPPKTVWPPPQGGKLRWKTARFIPLTLVPRLLAGEVLSDEQWAVDPVSECLLPVFRNSVATAPFRVVQRTLAPVDRVSGATESVDRVACLHFAPGGGMWFVAEFTDEEARSVWAGRMRSVARLLADSGIGGGRSRGWGRSREPQFGNVEFPEFLTGIAASAEGESAWWTLSLFSPADEDRIEWDRGTYSLTVRAGRMENGELKPASRMVAEGSVLVSGSPPAGTARNVAPAELSHPVYRSGIALSVRIPFQQRQRWEVLEHAPAAERVAPPPAVDEIPVGVDVAGETTVPEGQLPDVEAEFAAEQAETPSEPLPGALPSLPEGSTPAADETTESSAPGEEPEEQVEPPSEALSYASLPEESAPAADETIEGHPPEQGPEQPVEPTAEPLQGDFSQLSEDTAPVADETTRGPAPEREPDEQVEPPSEPLPDALPSLPEESAPAADETTEGHPPEQGPEQPVEPPSEPLPGDVPPSPPEGTAAAADGTLDDQPTEREPDARETRPDEEERN